MINSEDILSMFKLHIGDLVLSKNNTILLYNNDNSEPFGQIYLENGNCTLRFGFGTKCTRTSIIQRKQDGISFIPVIKYVTKYEN